MLQWQITIPVYTKEKQQQCFQATEYVLETMLNTIITLITHTEKVLKRKKEYIGHVRFSYNSSFSAETVFFSHNKSAETVF